jgi:hypothetical protein
MNGLLGPSASYPVHQLDRPADRPSMKIMPKKKTTLDELVQMIGRGFAQTTSKDDLKRVEARLDGEMKSVREDIQILRNDVGAGFQDLKHAFKPLRETVDDHDVELEELRGRLAIIEKKLGSRK